MAPADLIEIVAHPDPLATLSEDPRLRAAFEEFFGAHIRNSNTRRAYLAATASLLRFAGLSGGQNLRSITTTSVALWVEWMGHRHSIPTVKLRLAAVNMLFDWLVLRQVIATNPAASVKGPRYRVAKGKTPVLLGDEARAFVRSIDCSTVIGLRDRALIGVMLYTFARIGAVLRMDRSDVYEQGRRLWLRLNEKGGKVLEMPCHHELEEWLSSYIDEALSLSSTASLFQSVHRTSGELTGRRLQHGNAYAMVKRRAKRSGITTRVVNHTFRATGITSYLSNEGRLEMAAKMAGHSSTRTTQLYDRREDQVLLSEVERIRF